MNTISDIATRLAAALPGQWSTDHTLAAPILRGRDGERFQIGGEGRRPGGYTVHPRPPSGIRDAGNRVEICERAVHATESGPAVEVVHRMPSGLLHRYREALAQATAVDDVWRRDTADAEVLLDSLLTAVRFTRGQRKSCEHEVAASFFDDDRAGEITVSRTRDGCVCFTVTTAREHALRYAELLGQHTPPATSAPSLATHGKDGS